ncbi:MAG: hypothetical protein AB8B47_02860 [Roseobacter sp.]
MNIAWLMRMSMWARRPPSRAKIKLAAIVFAGVAVVFGLEYFGFWPDAMTAQRMRP